MFTLHAVQARFGDCFILEYGTDAAPGFILIDGGPPATFKQHLKPALKKIVKNNQLNLVVLSHIDNDHIVGLLDLFAALEEDQVNEEPALVAVGGLWHNSFPKTLDPDGEITARLQTVMNIAGSAGAAMPLAADAFYGVREGFRLRIMARKLGIPVNAGFPNDLIIAESAPKPLALGDLSLRVIGPTQTNLDALRTDWLDWLSRAEKQMSSDPETMANSDRSVPNLSSVVLLAESGGNTALLTGDARSDHIMVGLEQAGLLTGQTLHVNVLKVPHHGSERNTTAKFFRTVTADTYVVSADGKNGNPDYETLKWIVEAAKRGGRDVEIVVTNATSSTKQLTDTHEAADYGYLLTVKPERDHSIAVPVVG
jgi:hypothetical protein